MEELVKKLVEAFGPSGFEEDVRTLIGEEIDSFVDEVSVDALGNLVAHKAGDGSGRRVMVAAHMDEIGVMVSHVTKQGFLRFTNIGGVRRHTLMGARVRFADGMIGVVYSEKLNSVSSVHGLDKHYIDVGADSRETCPIAVGTPAAFDRSFVAQGDRFIAKSMDDRIGCVVAIEALKKLKQTPHDVYFVFSVQEEVGTRGALVAANMLEVDVGIALDVTPTGDTPNGSVLAVKLGAGPAIKVKDGGMISHPGLVRLMRTRAEEIGIPFQMEVLEGGTTDARSIQIAGSGAIAGCISVPCRYVHSQSEVVHVEDVRHSADLLVALLGGPLEV